MAGVIDTSEFRKGLKIEIDGEPFEITDFQHVKPGKGSAFTRTSIKSLLTGRQLQPTFKSGDKVGKPDIEDRDMQYLYKQGDDYYFMDNKNYEQTYVSEKVLGENKFFMKEQMNVQILFFNGKAIGISLPNAVELKVTKCDPGVACAPNTWHWDNVSVNPAVPFTIERATPRQVRNGS
ncbi:MAG: elongation factor P, partial [Myxococcaceae bacterium]